MEVAAAGEAAAVIAAASGTRPDGYQCMEDGDSPLEVFTGQDIKGHDLTGAPSVVETSASQCCMRCLKTPGKKCGGWVFVRGKGTCYLKGRVSAKDLSPNGSVTAGLLMT